MSGSGQVACNVQTGIRAPGALRIDRVIHVDLPGALLEYAVGELTLRVDRGARGRHQPAFHRIRRQRGIRLQHEGHCTADHCRRLRGARHDVQVVDVQLKRRVLLCDESRVSVHGADDVSPRRQDLGFDEALERRAGG